MPNIEEMRCVTSIHRWVSVLCGSCNKTIYPGTVFYIFYRYNRPSTIHIECQECRHGEPLIINKPTLNLEE